jgi:hypothetical protein
MIARAVVQLGAVRASSSQAADLVALFLFLDAPGAEVTRLRYLCVVVTFAAVVGLYGRRFSGLILALLDHPIHEV